PRKPHIAEFEEVPYTSATAEFNAVLAGNVDIGSVPETDLSQEPRVRAAGYDVVRNSVVETPLISMNFKNPVIGPFIDQLYIREVLNDLNDQPAQIKAILSGTGGYPQYGPVPPVPPNPFVAPIQTKSPFSISTARRLLTSHGWKIPASGAASCVRPGRAPSDCGAGIKKGSKLTFALVYSSGTGYFTEMMESYKSEASKAGVVLNLSQQPFNAIVGDICGNATCDSPGWQLAMYGAWPFRSPYAQGSIMFGGHVGLDYPVPSALASLIDATKTATASDTVKAMRAYDTWVVMNEPEIWELGVYTVNAVSSKVKGVAFNPVDRNVYPQDFTMK
ncbi:MAG: ABC transporter substrate-binding protein, partial [Nitrososphaerales archaeon]